MQEPSAPDPEPTLPCDGREATLIEMDAPCGPEPNVVDAFCGRLQSSIANGSFVRLVLSPCSSARSGPEKVLGRLVEIGGKLRLSLTFRFAQRDQVQNVPADDSGAWLAPRLGNVFGNGLLCTTRGDWQLSCGERRARLIRHKPSSKEVPSRAHDQMRRAILGSGASDWLVGLGLTDERGKVRAAMAHKLTQINRYLEIFSHLAKDAAWLSAIERGVTESGSWTVLDMGSGKGYLTFGLWYLLVRVFGLPVEVIGVETRGELVATTNGLARQIKAEGLRFVQGSIADAGLPNARALIALHACDTATDDAILRGVQMRAELIVLAPCCHKEVRPQLGAPEPLAPVLEHGLMAGRLADWLTDGLRALFLEWAGYRTKIFEFVEVEHTAKNLMISAVRARPPFQDPKVKDAIVRLKHFFGVERHALDPLLAKAPSPAEQ